MSQPEEAITDARVYAEALREALQKGKAQGATQKGLSESSGAHTSTVSRYLSGQLTAPETFVNELVSYLAALGVRLSASEVKQLHERRSAAQEKSLETAAQIAYWKEQVKQLQHAAKTGSRAEAALLQEAAEAKAELDVLVGDLAGALERARRAELERGAWHLATLQQRKRHEHTQRELASTQEAVELLLREIEVLRALLEEQVVFVEVEVYELRRQPGFANYIMEPFRARRSLEYRKVDTALKMLRMEFDSARQYYNLDNRKGTVQISEKIAELTGNKHWITVGKNVDHLTTIGSAIYASQEHGFAGTDNKPPMTPTIESVNSFVAGAETVLAQIKHLRQLTVL
ncbi:hypothetical protein [Streptomyces sp. R33]|uniref:HTH cro/C1-type domain-containing protein n=1 Tax=Streptomyces sp. R33 TaxID=3238629 RepID=A0AB39YFN4_9ACTN